MSFARLTTARSVGANEQLRVAEAAIVDTLGIRAVLALSDVPAPIESLTPGERALSLKCRPGPGRLDWLRGRAALKALLPAGYDTSALCFPNPTTSLTHAGGVALAVRSDDECEGIGIDFEPWGTGVERRAMHIFLNPNEKERLLGARNKQHLLGPSPEMLLRLWTVKEALFKATPANKGSLLLDFEVQDPTAASGKGTGPRGEQLRYATFRLGRGSLAIAVCGKKPQPS